MRRRGGRPARVSDRPGQICRQKDHAVREVAPAIGDFDPVAGRKTLDAMGVMRLRSGHDDLIVRARWKCLDEYPVSAHVS